MSFCGFELRVRGTNRSWFLAARVVTGLILTSCLAVSAAGAQEPGTEKWSIDRGGTMITGSPAIAPDGTILYFEYHETSVNVGYSELVAVTPEGTVRWALNVTEGGSNPVETPSPSYIHGSPVVSPDGTIYIVKRAPDSDLELFALDLDGNEIWHTDQPYGVGGQPVIGPDGTIYVGADAFTPGGVLKWSSAIASPWFSPVVAADGTVFYPGGSVLQAVDPEGSLLWTTPVGIRGDLAIGLDGAIYGDLMAVNPDGSIRWGDQPAGTDTGTSLGPDGTLYVATRDPCDLHAFGSDGTYLWSYPLWNACEWSYGAPTVARNGTILWATINHVVSVWDDGSLRWNFDMWGQGGHSSPAIGDDGTIYIGATTGVFYAIHDDNGGMAPSPWPTYQHDVRRMGSSVTKLRRLTEGVPFEAEISARGAGFFSFDAVPGESLLIELVPGVGIDSLTLSAQAVHDQFKADSPTPRGTYELLIAPTVEGTYYLTVFGDEIDPGGGEYTIAARYVTHHLSDLHPRSAGNAGEVSVLVRGLGFEAGMQVELEGAETLTPMAVEIDSEVELLAQFDLAGATVGLYDLEVTWPDMTLETLVDVFDIQPGIGPRLETNLVAPQFIRPDRKNVVWLEYSNTGDANLPAPLFTVRSNVLVSLDQGSIEGNEVEVLGVGGTSQPEILTPGEERRIPVYFIGPWGPHVAEFDLSITTDDAGVINWATYKDAMRPEDIAPAEWDTLWPDLIDRLGDTWGEYKQVLRSDAAHLADYGVPAHDVSRLLRSEIRVAQANPEGIVSGTLRHLETLVPLVGVRIRARSLDGLSIRQVETESARAGFFVLDGLEEGPYEIWVDDYRLEPPLILAVGLDATAGLELYAVDRVSEEAFRPAAPQHSPSLALDNPTPFAVWQSDGEIHWARNSSSGWDVTGVIPEAFGSRPVAAYDSWTGLLLVAWESAESPRRIFWSAGQFGYGTYTWSTPEPLTGDAFTDTGIALTLDLNHDLIVAWLQRDLVITDDSDLYSMLATAPSGVTEPRGSMPLLPWEEDEYQECFSIDFGKFYGLSRQVPVVGGDYGFSLSGSLCREEAACAVMQKGSLGTGVQLGDFLSIAGSFEADLKFKAQAGSNCEVSYVFDEGRLGLNLSGSGKPVVVVIPIPAIGGQVSISPVITASTSGEMVWKSLPIGLPDEGGFNFSLGVVPTVEIEALGGVATGSASGSGTVFGKHFSPAPDPTTCVLSRGNFCLEKYCFALEGKLEVLWGLLANTWKKEWCDPAPSPPPPQPFSVRVRGDELVIERHQLGLGEEDVPIYEEAVYTKEAHVGTGGVYEGVPVLSNVELDILNDGRPSIARSPAGEILVAWSKDEAAASLGGRIHVASWTGTEWDAPIQLSPTVELVKEPSIIFDSTGNPMVVWSQASNDGLDYNDPPGSLIPELLAAAEVADIFYSRRVGDVWSAPTEVATLPGRDEQTALAAESSGGELAAAWLNESGTGWTVYVSIWNGSAWSAPEAIASAEQAAGPSLDYKKYGPLVLWSQDTDDDPETADDWKIYWSGMDYYGNWSDPAPVTVVGSASSSEANNAGSNAPESWDIGPPPEECCSGGSVDPPSPPGGSQSGAGGATSEYVYGFDPNEKVGTAGVGVGGYIEAGERLGYQVHFENLPAATAPAQEVFVTDCLPAELDWSTLRLNEVAFGDVIVANPGDDALFSHRVTIPDYRGEQSNWWVEIESELDLMFEPGCLKVTFRTLDPATGELPMDPFAGFLPPEDGTGRGQGHIGFSIDTLADLPDGTEIVNQASIVFDTNAAIVTNEHLNTIGTPEGSHTLTVGHAGIGTGTVTSDPAGIDCGSDCSEIYPAWTSVTLTPTPDPGSEFRKWQGDSECYDGEVSLTKSMTCTAVFEEESMFFDGFESGDLSSWSLAVQ